VSLLVVKMYINENLVFETGGGGGAKGKAYPLVLKNCISVIKTNKTSNVRINVTLRRIRETIVAVEKQYVLHVPSVCVCVRACVVCRGRSACVGLCVCVRARARVCV
jgi:hypothetical protein